LIWQHNPQSATVTVPPSPHEIRNEIYADAYQEHRIVVQRSGCRKLTLAVALDKFDTKETIRTYPLSVLLATTTVCRQIYAETAALPMTLNSLHVVQINTFVDLADRVPTYQLARIRSIRMYVSFVVGYCRADIASSMTALTSLENAVVLMNTGSMSSKGIELLKTYQRRLIEECVGRELRVIFESCADMVGR